MKVLYHVGVNISSQTVMKKGNIDENSRPIKLETENEITLDGLQDVMLCKFNGMGTMIILRNYGDTIYLVVHRLYFNVGTGFVICNYFATKKLKTIIESTQEK